jgi:oligopeptide transport system substrate-binding protein
LNVKTILRIALVLAAGMTLVTLLCSALTAAAAETPPIPHATASTTRSAADAHGGEFRFAIVEPDTLDPADPDSEGAIVGQIFEGLTKWGDSLEPRPAVAHSWESSDAQHWTFHIRPDIRFHNGTLLTPADVEYSFDRVAAAGHWGYDYMVAPLINTVTAVGTDTLQITLNEPFAPLPSLLALPFMSIVPSETVSTIGTVPVGNGPFKMAGPWAGDIVLTRYDGYWENADSSPAYVPGEGLPYLDRITYQFYDDEDDMYADYLLGNLDLSPVPCDRIDEVVGSPHAIFVTSLESYYFGMKVDWPPFNDRRVRQALNYAVDRQDIVDNVAPGYQVVAEGPVPPGMQGYDPPVPPYPYSPTLALALLAQAGWTDTNGDDILDDGAGTDLEIELWHNTGETHRDIAESVAQAFRDIGGSGLGATVVISHADGVSYLTHLDEYPMYRLGWIPDYNDLENYVTPLFHSEGVWNYGNYDNSQVDAWLEQARITLDEWTTRRLMLETIETQVQDDAPLINLFYPGKVYVKGEDVLGLVIPGWGLEAIPMERVRLFRHDHDVAVEAILYPKESVLAGEPMTPVVRVRNAGRSDETNVPVRCRILRGGSEVFSDDQTIEYLASERHMLVDPVAGPMWMSCGDYTIECTTLLPGDEDTTNDQVSQDFAVTEDAFYDVMIRTSPADDGSVPVVGPWWQSPDVLIRNQDNGEGLIIGDTHYVFELLANVGQGAISDGYLNLYWHPPSPGIICSDWMPINSRPIAVGTLGPGESRWVEVAWVPPVAGNVCLFAEFWSGDDPVTSGCAVAADNNIAQLNVSRPELGVGQQREGIQTRALAQAGQVSTVFEVINVRDLPTSVDLIVQWATFPPSGTAALEFSRDLFSRWQDAGATVEGGTVVPGTSRISLTHPVSTAIVGLPMGVREMQRARMTLTGPRGAEFEFHVTERIYDSVVGGVTYRAAIPAMIYLPVTLRDYSAGP